MKTFNNSKSSQGESKVVKYLLITTAITFLAVMLSSSFDYNICRSF